MDENQGAKRLDFLNQIASISNPTKTEIKDTCLKLSVDPIPSEYFWILSRQITLASVSDLQTLQSTITDLLNKNKLKYISASFAASNLAKRISYENCKEFVVPLNPEVSISLIQSFASSETEIRLSTLLRYLDYPSYKVQKAAASAISSCCSDRKELLRSALAALSKSETISPLTFPFPVKDEDVRYTGILLLCRFLLFEEVSLKLVLDSVNLILSSKTLPSSSVEAQLFLASLILSNPTSFHPYYSLLSDIILAQCETEKLQKELFSAFLGTFGLFAVKKIGIILLPILIDKFSNFGRNLIPSLIPYLIYFPTAMQLSLHQFLVERCSMCRFDSELIEMTASAMIALAPSVSPHCGKFMEIAKRTVRAAYVATLLKPLLEPNGVPPPHEVSLVIAVDEKDKRFVEVQVNPYVESIGTQIGTSSVSMATTETETTKEIEIETETEANNIVHN